MQIATEIQLLPKPQSLLLIHSFSISNNQPIAFQNSTNLDLPDSINHTKIQVLHMLHLHKEESSYSFYVQFHLLQSHIV
nr:MAG TPA: hypothetical protein [Caudoviricetes sp.]